MNTRLALFLSLVLIARMSFAEVLPIDESQDPQSSTYEAKTSKHEDVPESSPSSPPLATDDPGTPGPLGVEVNLITEVDSFKGGQVSASGIDANLGLGETIQLRLSKETTKQEDGDLATVYGHTATSLGLKWRFFDNNGLKIAIYPSYQFDDASVSEGEDSEGRSLSVPLILSKNFGLYTLVVNLGQSRNLDHSDKWENLSAVALGRSVSETLRVMTEVVSINTTEGQRVDAKLGFVKEIFPDEASKYETGIFGSIGHSLGWTEDNKDHLSVVVGFAIAVKPQTEGVK